MANAWYQRPTVTICYEYVDDIQKGIPKGTHEGITQTDAVLGQFFYVVAHEMGHAIFDTLNVPVFGHPEDDRDAKLLIVASRSGTPCSKKNAWWLSLLPPFQAEVNGILRRSSKSGLPNPATSPPKVNELKSTAFI